MDRSADMMFLLRGTSTGLVETLEEILRKPA
jgi:hypothetical protein